MLCDPASTVDRISKELTIDTTFSTVRHLEATGIHEALNLPTKTDKRNCSNFPMKMSRFLMLLNVLFYFKEGFLYNTVKLFYFRDMKLTAECS